MCRTTVADINRNMAENLRYCGPALIASEATLQHVIHMVTDIITKKHPCQMEFGEEEGEGAEETSEFDWVVVDTALDVVSGMAAALGESFGELWKVFEKTILRYAGSSEALERATAVGVIAEVINGMGAATTPFTPALLKLLLHRLGDEDPQTKSNAAYAVGRLVQHSNAASEITNEYPTILSRLEACLPMNFSRLPDNATGCVSRMILRHRDHVPVKDVLPVLVGILPLTNDYEENEPLFRMICQMCKFLEVEDDGVLVLTLQTLGKTRPSANSLPSSSPSSRRCSPVTPTSWKTSAGRKSSNWSSG